MIPSAHAASVVTSSHVSGEPGALSPNSLAVHNVKQSLKRGAVDSNGRRVQIMDMAVIAQFGNISTTAHQDPVFAKTERFSQDLLLESPDVNSAHGV